jgi:hypothetical protein
MARRLSQLLTCLLLLTLTQTAFLQPSQVATTSARLIEADGEVQSRHAAGGYKAAKVGETLVPGDDLKAEVSPDEIARHCLAQGRIVQVTCGPGAAPE